MGLYCTLVQVTDYESRRIRPDLGFITTVLERAPRPNPPSTRGEFQRMLFDLPTPPTPEYAAAESVRLGKMWHAIHFLLTEDSTGGEPPLAWAVLGGTFLGVSQEYGSVHLLNPDEVRHVSSALSSLTREELRHRFDPEEFAATGIYPGVWDEDRERLADELLGYVDRLAASYRQASERGNGVLILVT